MESKLKYGSFFIAFVCGHKDTTIFVITVYNVQFGYADES